MFEHMTCFFLCFICAEMRTWIVGDSLIRDAGENNPQLLGGGRVVWLGLSGARLINIENRFRRRLFRNEFPTTVIIHLGTNDVLRSPTIEIRGRILETLVTLRRLLPTTRIIWSAILPRLGYAEEKTPGAGGRCTVNLNKYARSVVRSGLLGGNAHAISHSGSFNPRRRNVDGPLYRYDCVHLTPLGSSLLRENFQNALVHFNSHPGDLFYPVRG